MICLTLSLVLNYFTYSFNGFTLNVNSPNSHVGTYPGLEFITSGILFTTEAQVSSTVAGFATTIVVSGSPYTVHSFLSNSSGAYTFPMHSLSII